MSEMNKVNKKLLIRSYTSTPYVLSMKKELKKLQKSVRDYKKRIKFFESEIEYFLEEPKQNGNTTTSINHYENTISDLKALLSTYEECVVIKSEDIQHARQKIFESLKDYCPDYETAKKRFVRGVKLDS